MPNPHCRPLKVSSPLPEYWLQYLGYWACVPCSAPAPPSTCPPWYVTHPLCVWVCGTRPLLKPHQSIVTAETNGLHTVHRRYADVIHSRELGLGSDVAQFTHRLFRQGLETITCTPINSSICVIAEDRLL